MDFVLWEAYTQTGTRIAGYSEAGMTTSSWLGQVKMEPGRQVATTFRDFCNNKKWNLNTLGVWVHHVYVRGAVLMYVCMYVHMYSSAQCLVAWCLSVGALQLQGCSGWLDLWASAPSLDHLKNFRALTTNYWKGRSTQSTLRTAERRNGQKIAQGPFL